MYVALARAGLVAVPINFRLVAAEIEYIATHCEARAFIVQDELVERVEPIRDELGIVAGGYVHFGGDRAPAGWQSYEALIARASSNAPDVDVAPTDTWALMYTSGTTGRPKGAIRNHAGSALISLVTALDMGFARDHTALLVMPMCHANSLYFSFTFTYLGAECVIDDRKSFDPEHLLRTLSERHVTFTSLVPTHYIMMLDLPGAVKAQVRRRQGEQAHDLLGARAARDQARDHGALPQLAALRAVRLDRGRLGHAPASGRAVDEARLASAANGRARVRCASSTHDGRDVPDGEVGELFSCTPYVFDGYWKNPEKTAEAFRGAWCSVGDMARRDEDGFYHLVDRKSNMIISGGENIYPSEVEAMLAAHPAVQDVAVIGMPDDKWGEAVHAVVVRRDGGKVTEAELLAWCRDKHRGLQAAARDRVHRGGADAAHRDGQDPASPAQGEARSVLTVLRASIAHTTNPAAAAARCFNV